jgi:CubicO group peptidase (beta-lactamase class C family)
VRLFPTCCGLLLSTAALAQPLRSISPDQAGFSKEGLARIDKFFEREIQADRVPGAVVAIARDGRLVYYQAHGFLNKAIREPMPVDAIFNLASMTKILVSVGGLALNEQGRLPLKSRLDQYFPSFAKMTVGEPPGPDSKGEPARPIYIHDLFRHTSGIPYGGRGNTPVQKLYPSSSGSAAAQYTGEELIAKLSSLPLLHQPGTVWEYGFSTDVLGLVIEKTSGKRLGDYLKAVVWDKVEMPDTGFQVPLEKRKRLARPLPKDPIDGKDQNIAILDQPVKFDCAGSCAFSTVGDFLRFGQMLVDGGAIDGRRVLSPKTIAWMTSDHLGGIWNHVASIEPHREGYGFGLGVAVRLQDGVSATPGTQGDFTWNGANGTAFWADPQERLVVVYGTAAPGEIRKYYREQMAALVYGALTELRGNVPRKRP